MSAPSEAQLDPAPRRREGHVVGLISGGHFMSHFFVLCLPPLFPILKVEFDVSYVELGLAMTAYGLLGGFMQAPVGFLVDRFGPRNLLFAGLGLNAGAILMMGFAQNFEMLLVFAVLAGLGNSVFHPADYAILNGSIHPDRLGRAFSMHTFSGFFGSACAPVGILALVSYTDWRVALISVGLFGLLIWAVMLLCRSSLQGAAAPDTDDGDVSKAPGRTGIRLLLSPPVLLFLGFFIAYGMVTGGLRAFSVTALVNLHGLGLDQANAALTGFLFGVVGGILLAGVIVDRVSAARPHRRRCAAARAGLHHCADLGRSAGARPDRPSDHCRRRARRGIAAARPVDPRVDSAGGDRQGVRLRLRRFHGRRQYRAAVLRRPVGCGQSVADLRSVRRLHRVVDRLCHRGAIDGTPAAGEAGLGIAACGRVMSRRCYPLVNPHVPTNRWLNGRGCW